MKDTLEGRTVGILIADGSDGKMLDSGRSRPSTEAGGKPW